MQSDQEALAASSRSAQLALVVLIGLSVALLGGASTLTGNFLSRPVLAIDPRLDLNRASAAELTLLPGIGPTLAERIEQHRADNGPFTKVDDLLDVKGIGPTRLGRIRAEVFVGEGDVPPRTRRPSSTIAPLPSRVPNRIEVKKAPGHLDPNTATLAQLQTLPGIGPKLSQRIIDERGKQTFATVEDLRRVKGIGPKTIEKVRPFVVIESSRLASGK